MPTKKAVVKSEAVAAVSPAVEKAPAKTVRKRSTTSASKTSATEVMAPASGEKKAATRKKSAVAEAAVTHRHAKKQESTSLELPVAVVAPAATPARYEPSHDEVAKLAYSYYVARGYQPGDQQADWFRAVEELKARHAAAASLLAE
jgi:hypothetical protein